MKYRVIEILFTSGTKMYGIMSLFPFGHYPWMWEKPAITAEGENSPRLHGYFSTKQQAVDALNQFIMYGTEEDIKETTVVFEISN